MDKTISFGLRHIEAPITTMKCPMDLKMRRDLPENISNRNLTKIPTSDIVIPTSGSLPMAPSELKKSIIPLKIDYSCGIPDGNPDGHRGHQSASTDLVRTRAWFYNYREVFVSAWEASTNIFGYFQHEKRRTNLVSYCNTIPRACMLDMANTSDP